MQRDWMDAAYYNYVGLTSTTLPTSLDYFSSSIWVEDMYRDSAARLKACRGHGARSSNRATPPRPKRANMIVSYMRELRKCRTLPLLPPIT